jgi:hypothetical protein
MVLVAKFLAIVAIALRRVNFLILLLRAEVEDLFFRFR